MSKKTLNPPKPNKKPDNHSIPIPQPKKRPDSGGWTKA